MKIITEINEANAILRTYIGARAKIFMFSPSLGRLAIRLKFNELAEEVLYLVGVSCDYISGEFSFDNADFQVSSGPEEGMTNIIDNNGRFKLVTSGGFVVAEGLEKDFGSSFDNFILNRDDL